MKDNIRLIAFMTKNYFAEQISPWLLLFIAIISLGTYRAGYLTGKRAINPNDFLNGTYKCPTTRRNG